MSGGTKVVDVFVDRSGREASLDPALLRQITGESGGTQVVDGFVDRSPFAPSPENPFAVEAW